MTKPLRNLDGIEVPAVGIWKLDPAHSVLSFSARHLMVAKVRGQFDRFQGTVTIGDRPEDTSIDVTIEAAGITTNQEQRDEHLRSADFLDVERYRSLTFRSTSTERSGDRTLRVTGDLTIRDTTRPVTLDVTYEGAASPPWGGVAAGFSAVAELDREEFGMTWNQALEAGGFLVGKKVRIEIEAELVPSE
ncbi:MAG: YceI family protein [Actinomycetota bacterium]